MDRRRNNIKLINFNHILNKLLLFSYRKCKKLMHFLISIALKYL